MMSNNVDMTLLPSLLVGIEVIIFLDYEYGLNASELFNKTGKQIRSSLQASLKSIRNFIN